MSANNWTICPRCKLRTEVAKLEAFSKAQALYGVVSADEYIELIREAERLPSGKNFNQTEFRENYEIGVRGSKFFVSYGGSCADCDFSYSFEHEVEDITKS